MGPQASCWWLSATDPVQSVSAAIVRVFGRASFYHQRYIDLGADNYPPLRLSSW